MNNKEEKIYNSISKCQQSIQELEKLNSKIMSSEGECIRFRIETKHWYGYGIDIHIGKERRLLNISKYTMHSIISQAILREKGRINSFIDKLIEERSKNQNEKRNFTTGKNKQYI